MSGPYDDIIDLPRPTSTRHPRVSMIDRAAQFSPFRALTGYEDAIQETSRLTDRRIELDEHAKAALDEKLRLLADMAEEHPEAAVTYFVPDEKKAGGEYRTAAGRLKKIDGYAQTLVFTTGQVIPIQDILTVRSECFKYFCDE